MKQEVRDILGKAAYHERMKGSRERFIPSWETLHPVLREGYRREAQAVVKAFAGLLFPVVFDTLLSHKEIAEALAPIVREALGAEALGAQEVSEDSFPLPDRAFKKEVTV